MKYQVNGCTWLERMLCFGASYSKVDLMELLKTLRGLAAFAPRQASANLPQLYPQSRFERTFGT